MASYIPTKRHDYISQNTKNLIAGLQEFAKPKEVVQPIIPIIQDNKERILFAEATKKGTFEYQGRDLYKEADKDDEIGKIWVKKEIMDPVTGEKQSWLVVYTTDEDEIVRKLTSKELQEITKKADEYASKLEPFKDELENMTKAASLKKKSDDTGIEDPYTGPAGSERGHANKNYKALKFKLKQAGIPFTETIISEYAATDADEDVLKVVNQRGRKGYVGYDRWGYVFEGPGVPGALQVDQGDINTTMDAIRKFMGVTASLNKKAKYNLYESIRQEIMKREGYTEADMNEESIEDSVNREADKEFKKRTGKEYEVTSSLKFSDFGIPEHKEKRFENNQLAEGSDEVGSPAWVRMELEKAPITQDFMIINYLWKQAKDQGVKVDANQVIQWFDNYVKSEHYTDFVEDDEKFAMLNKQAWAQVIDKSGQKIYQNIEGEDVENNLHQQILDTMDETDFSNIYNNCLAEAASLLGSLNYQVENGGWDQWYGNRGYEKASKVITYLTEIDSSAALKTINLIRRAIKLNKELSDASGSHLGEVYDEEDGDDYNGLLLDKLDKLDDEYYAINDQLLIDINGWLHEQKDKTSSLDNKGINTMTSLKFSSENISDVAFDVADALSKKFGEPQNHRMIKVPASAVEEILSSYGYHSSLEDIVIELEYKGFNITDGPKSKQYEDPENTQYGKDMDEEQEFFDREVNGSKFSAGTPNPKDIPIAQGIKNKSITMDESGAQGTAKVTVEFTDVAKGLKFYQDEVKSPDQAPAEPDKKEEEPTQNNQAPSKQQTPPAQEPALPNQNLMQGMPMAAGSSLKKKAGKFLARMQDHELNTLVNRIKENYGEEPTPQEIEQFLEEDGFDQASIRGQAYNASDLWKDYFLTGSRNSSFKTSGLNASLLTDIFNEKFPIDETPLQLQTLRSQAEKVIYDLENKLSGDYNAETPDDFPLDWYYSNINMSEANLGEARALLHSIVDFRGAQHDMSYYSNLQSTIVQTSKQQKGTTLIRDVVNDKAVRYSFINEEGEQIEVKGNLERLIPRHDMFVRPDNGQYVKFLGFDDVVYSSKNSLVNMLTKQASLQKESFSLYSLDDVKNRDFEITDPSDVEALGENELNELLADADKYNLNQAELMNIKLRLDELTKDSSLKKKAELSRFDLGVRVVYQDDSGNQNSGVYVGNGDGTVRIKLNDGSVVEVLPNMIINNQAGVNINSSLKKKAADGFTKGRTFLLYGENGDYLGNFNIKGADHYISKKSELTLTPEFQEFANANSITEDQVSRVQSEWNYFINGKELSFDWYEPSDSQELFDDETNTWYNRSGQQLRSPKEYDTNTEGYTPFGDEGDPYDDDDRYGSLKKKAGTWSYPNTAMKAQKLITYLDTLDNGEELNKTSVDDSLYNLVGDDELFDEIIDLEKREELTAENLKLAVGQTLSKWLEHYKSNPDDWSGTWDPKAMELLDDWIREQDYKASSIDTLMNKSSMDALINKLAVSEAGDFDEDDEFDTPAVGSLEWIKKTVTEGEEYYSRTGIVPDADNLIGYILDMANEDGEGVTEEDAQKMWKKYYINARKEMKNINKRKGSVESLIQKLSADISDQVPPMGWNVDQNKKNDNMPPAKAPLDRLQGKEEDDSPGGGVLYDSNTNQIPQFQTTVNPTDKSVTVKFMDNNQLKDLNKKVNNPAQPNPSGGDNLDDLPILNTVPPPNVTENPVLKEQNVPVNY